MLDTIYALGPTLFGFAAALAIAFYLWGRLRIASIIVLAWFVVAAAIGQVSLFTGFPEWQDGDWRGFLVFGTLAFLPAGLLLLAALRVTQVKTALADVPTSALVLTQAYRFGGVFLIMAFVRGELPAAVGLVTGVLDVIVASSAIAIGLYLRGDESRAPRLVMAWAVLALVDFGWATSMVFASFLGVLNLDPAPVMMGNPPLLIISLFALPFGIFISVYVILRVRRVLAYAGSAQT